MANSTPSSRMTVADVLAQWPETVPVFQKLKTDCVGCAMTPFDTISDVADIYEIDLSNMMELLAAAISEASNGRDVISE